MITPIDKNSILDYCQTKQNQSNDIARYRWRQITQLVQIVIVVDNPVAGVEQVKQRLREDTRRRLSHPILSDCQQTVINQIYDINCTMLHYLHALTTT